jgi:hypothetical protein
MEEESGTPVTEPGPVRTPITLVPPPLNQAQVDKVIHAIDAVKEAVEAVGSLAWPLFKWAFGRVVEGLRAIPTAPITPPLGTQEPTTPPATTP